MCLCILKHMIARNVMTKIKIQASRSSKLIFRHQWSQSSIWMSFLRWSYNACYNQVVTNAYLLGLCYVFITPNLKCSHIHIVHYHRPTPPHTESRFKYYIIIAYYFYPGLYKKYSLLCPLSTWPLLASNEVVNVFVQGMIRRPHRGNPPP